MNASGIERDITFDSGMSLSIREGDITRITVDVIVNAANRHLKHGGGVAGAISRRGGSAIQQESNNWIRQHGTIDENHPAHTGGGNLPCKYVVHTAGPVWGEGDEDRKLSRAITSSLEMAEKLKAHSLSMPAISTGIFGFPVERAAGIFMQTVNNFCTRAKNKYVNHILIVLFDRNTLNVFVKAFDSFSWGQNPP